MLIVRVKNDVHGLTNLPSNTFLNEPTAVAPVEVVPEKRIVQVREELPIIPEHELLQLPDEEAAKALWLDDFDRAMKSISDMWHHINQDDMELAKMVSKHTSRVASSMKVIRECVTELDEMYSTIVSGWWFNRKYEAPEVTHDELTSFVNRMQHKLRDCYSTGDFERGGIDDYANDMKMRLDKLSMILDGAFSACQQIIDEGIDHIGIDIKQQQVQKLQTVVGMSRTSLKQVMLLLEVDMSKLNEIHNVVIPSLYTQLKPLLAEQVTSVLPDGIKKLVTLLACESEKLEKRGSEE